MNPRADIRSRFDNIRWPRLLPGMVLTAVVSLSVHVLMLQALHVPYPSGFPKTGWLIYVNSSLGVLAIIYFYDLAKDKLDGVAIWWRCLALSGLVAMLREALIRAPLMDGVVTTAWIYSIVSNLAPLIQILVVCCLVVPIAPKLNRVWQKLIAAFALCAFVYFVSKPLVDAGLERMLQYLSPWSHDAIYSVPYPWQVEVPAYLTFAEPVVACFIMAALVFDRLSADPVARVCQFAVLILLMRNLLLAPFIYIFYAKIGAVSAMLSMDNFPLRS